MHRFFIYLQSLAQVLEDKRHCKIIKGSDEGSETFRDFGCFLTHSVYSAPQYKGRLSVLGKFLRRLIEEDKDRIIFGCWHDVDTDHEHLRLVHSCIRFNGQCRCYYNRTVSLFGKPEHRSVFRPDNAEGVYNLFQYFRSSRSKYNFYFIRRERGGRSFVYIDDISYKQDLSRPQEELVDARLKHVQFRTKSMDPRDPRTKATGNLIATVESNQQRLIASGTKVKKDVRTRNW